MILVNGAAFVALAVILDSAFPEWAPRVVVLAALAAASVVIVPYDMLSYVAISAAFMVAVRGRPGWQVVAVVAVGVAVRESVLLAVPAMAVAGVSRRVWLGAGAGGVVTYEGLHRLAGSPGIVPVPIHQNLTTAGLLGVATAMMLALVVLRPARGRAERRRAVFWAVAVPYLAVIVAGRHVG